LKSTDSSPASDNPHSHSEFLNKKDLCADVILHSRSEICAEILDGIKGSAANRQYLQRLLSLGTPQRPSIPKIAELPSESEYPGPLQLSGNDHSAGTSHRNQLELQVDSVAGNQSSVENPHDQEQLGLRARENPNFSSMAGSSLDSDYPDSVLPESYERSVGTSLRNQLDVHDEIFAGNQTRVKNTHFRQLESFCNHLGFFLKKVSTPSRFFAIFFVGVCALLSICVFHLQYLIWIGKMQLVNGRVLVVL